LHTENGLPGPPYRDFGLDEAGANSGTNGFLLVEGIMYVDGSPEAMICDVDRVEVKTI
jgi:hypothetical protein